MSPPHSNLSILFISNRVVLQFMATYYVQLASHKFIRLVHIIYFDMLIVFSQYFLSICSIYFHLMLSLKKTGFLSKFGVFNEVQVVPHISIRESLQVMLI